MLLRHQVLPSGAGTAGAARERTIQSVTPPSRWDAASFVADESRHNTFLPELIHISLKLATAEQATLGQLDRLSDGWCDYLVDRYDAAYGRNSLACGNARNHEI